MRCSSNEISRSRRRGVICRSIFVLGACLVDPARCETSGEAIPPQSRSAKCAALFRGNHCQLEKKLPDCLRRVFSGSWLSLHLDGPAGVAGVLAAADPWLKSFRDIDRNESQRLLGLLPHGDAINLTAPWSGHRITSLHSCALVGSSSELLGSNLGAVIDKHDVVVRLNRAPVRGFESDVGSFTTLRYTNNFNEGFREVDHEAVIASKWCSAGPPCGFHEAVRRLGGKKVHALNPAFVAYARRDTFAADVGHNPSSGFTATLLLLHLCHAVNIYGFSVFQDNPRMKQWYYNHDHRPSPQEIEFRSIGLSTTPPARLRVHQENGSVSHQPTKIVSGKPPATNVKLSQSQHHTLPTYDRLWWSVGQWRYVLPRHDLRDSAAARRSPTGVQTSESFYRRGPSSTQRQRGSTSRNVLAQSLFIGHEKSCLRSLHKYGLISATDGSRV